MKKIADEKKRAVRESFQTNPEKPFIEVAKETEISRVTILHWYQCYLIGDETWVASGKQGFRHYDEKKKELQSVDSQIIIIKIPTLAETNSQKKKTGRQARICCL